MHFFFNVWFNKHNLSSFQALQICIIEYTYCSRTNWANEAMRQMNYLNNNETKKAKSQWDNFNLICDCFNDLTRLLTLYSFSFLLLFIILRWLMTQWLIALWWPFDEWMKEQINCQFFIKNETNTIQQKICQNVISWFDCILAQIKKMCDQWKCIFNKCILAIVLLLCVVSVLFVCFVSFLFDWIDIILRSGVIIIWWIGWFKWNECNTTKDM